MTTAGNQGQNVYPSPDNYPVSSFPQKVPPPDGEPDDEGTLIFVKYSWIWREVLMAAIDQLLNPATWQGDHDQIILALDRANLLKDLIQTPVTVSDEVQTPFWDDETDVDDNEPVATQTWYGEVTNPTAPAGELDFVESVALWAFTGLVAVATFEVAGIAPAIAFHTFVEKFIIIQKRGDVGETIRFVVDHQDSITIDTTPYAPGELIETTIVTPQTGMGHDLMIIGGSS